MIRRRIRRFFLHGRLNVHIPIHREHLLRSMLNASMIDREQCSRSPEYVPWHFDELGHSVTHMLRRVGLRSLEDGIDKSEHAGQMCFTIIATVAYLHRQHARVESCTAACDSLFQGPRLHRLRCPSQGFASGLIT